MKKICFLLVLIFIFSLPVNASESYQLAYPVKDGYARIVKDLKWGLVNDRLEPVLTPKWDFLGDLTEGFRLIRSGTLSGFADHEGKQVIAPQFIQAENFSQGLSAVKNDEGKWGYISTTGELVIPYQYDEANSFSDGLALIRTEGLYGYIDKENNAVIPPTYTEAYPFSENLACIKSEGGYGYIHTDGSLAITPQYELAFDFCEGVAVIKNGQYGLIDTSGKTLIVPSFDRLFPMSKNGLLKAEKGGKMAFVNTSGQPKTEFLYTDLGDFSEGFCPVGTSEGYGYINSSFELVLSPTWEQTGDFSDGLAPVKKDGLWGYIDTEGNLKTDYCFTEASSFAFGSAVVCTEDGSWQFVTANTLSSFTSEETPYEMTTESRTLLLEIDHSFLYTPTGTVPLDAAPVITDGHTMLPIRAVIEAIGGTVTWNAESQKITIEKDGHVLILTLNKTAAIADGRLTLMSAAPVIENGRTLCPLRFVTEALDCHVTWNGETKQILISY